MQKSLQTLPLIAKAHYRITPKGAGIQTLDLTPIQLRIHYLLQALLEKRGYAHMAIVKPRQIRSTTYFNAAEFKLSQDIEGLKTLILTHRAKVTTEIFENLKRFQEQMEPELRQETTQSNDYKLAWKNLSEISTGTAGTDSARGFPCLILQLSELGRCKDRHVKDIQEGAMNAHASTYPGNIIAAESTSGGEGNFFHEISKSGYKNPKSPWFTAFFGWQEEPEYQMTPPTGWVPDSDEVRIMKMLDAEFEKIGSPQRMTPEQMYWRHVKLHHHMRGNLTAFQREFPATFEEAFQSAEGKLIDSIVLLNALNSSTQIDRSQPRILGVDPAGKGDRTALVYRQGYVMPEYEVFNRMDDVTLANIIIERVHKKEIDHVFIDMGYGHGTYNLVRNLGFRNITGIHFGSKANNTQLYYNKRAEMAGEFQDWIEEGPDSRGGTAKIPDSEEFARDIRMIPDLEYSGDAQKFKLATKEEIKAELGRSPDIFDAAILTFAERVKSKRLALGQGASIQQSQSLLTTENNFREIAGDINTSSNPNFKYHSFDY